MDNTSQSQKNPSQKSARTKKTSVSHEGVDLSQKIKGWGVDLDPKNRPAYHMWNRPEHGTGAHYDHPPQQLTQVKIHKSTERADITAVFGTVAPPKGLSGIIRNLAYSRFSEAQARHWLLLLLADRVDMVEGVVDDLKQGHVPNLYKEMGLASEWKFNRTRFLTKIATTVGIGAGVLYFMTRRGRTQ